MTYWIGVVGSPEGVERLRNLNETWWCLPAKSAPGDLIAMYVARSRMKWLPEEQGGVVATFRVSGPEPTRADDCRKYGSASLGTGALIPVRISFKERYAVSLRLAHMKRDRLLAQSTFVRRSFQGTFFEVSPTEYLRIEKLLAAGAKRSTAEPIVASDGAISRDP